MEVREHGSKGGRETSRNMYKILTLNCDGSECIV